MRYQKIRVWLANEALARQPAIAEMERRVEPWRGRSSGGTSRCPR